MAQSHGTGQRERDVQTGSPDILDRSVFGTIAVTVRSESKVKPREELRRPERKQCVDTQSQPGARDDAAPSSDAPGSAI